MIFSILLDLANGDIEEIEKKLFSSHKFEGDVDKYKYMKSIKPKLSLEEYYNRMTKYGKLIEADHITCIVLIQTCEFLPTITNIKPKISWTNDEWMEYFRNADNVLKNLGSPSTHNKDIRNFSNLALTPISSKSFQLENPRSENLSLLSGSAVKNSRTPLPPFNYYTESTPENSIYYENKSGPRSEPKEKIILNTFSKVTEYHDIKNIEQLNKLIGINLNHMHINFFNLTDKLLCVYGYISNKGTITYKYSKNRVNTSKNKFKAKCYMNMLTTLHLLRWQKALVTMKDRSFFNLIKDNIVINEFTKTDASQFTVLLQSISIDVGIVDDINFGLIHHMKTLQSTLSEKNTKCAEQDGEYEFKE